MEKRVLAALAGVEASLDALAGSIIAYNPSLPAAEALVAADRELKRALCELCAHQNNARQLAVLRRDLDAAEAANRARLAALGRLHGELDSYGHGHGHGGGAGGGIDAGAGLSAPRGAKVDVRELLNVAAATAKYAAPVGYRAPEWGLTNGGGSGVDQQQEDEREKGNGASPNQGPGAATAFSPSDAAAVFSPSAAAADDSNNLGSSSLPPTQPFTDSQPPGPVDSNGNYIGSGGGGGGGENQPLSQQPADNPGLAAVAAEGQQARHDPDSVGDFVPWVGERAMARSWLARSQGVDLGMIVEAQAQTQAEAEAEADAGPGPGPGAGVGAGAELQDQHGEGGGEAGGAQEGGGQQEQQQPSAQQPQISGDAAATAGPLQQQRQQQQQQQTQQAQQAQAQQPPNPTSPVLQRRESKAAFNWGDDDDDDDD